MHPNLTRKERIISGATSSDLWSSLSGPYLKTAAAAAFFWVEEMKEKRDKVMAQKKVTGETNVPRRVL